MPGCCGARASHARKLTPCAAPAALWLAVIVHVASGTSACGSDASSSSIVHGAFRPVVAARTLATSAGVTTQPLPPKPLRTYDATAAIHSSVFVPIGTMTSPYFLPSTGPVMPCRIVLMT